MQYSVPFNQNILTFRIDLGPDQVVFAALRTANSGRNWAEVVAETIHSPVGVNPIRGENLRGKRVCVITDDWGRPTPASEVVPLILEELAATGAADEDITFVTASGMHAPMSRDDLGRKLGAAVLANYRCVSHDGGDWESLSFRGITRQGTPIWVNRWVAEADYKIALGRIYLHETYGYEGGYKMILPGVSGFDTITRDHSFNFSPDAVAGVHENPSRSEADAVGQMVGIDFLINVVVNAASQPIKAFCGEPMQVHRLGIAYGDHEVWGAEVGEPADIVIASPGANAPTGEYDMETLYRAARVARVGGTIICAAREDTAFREKEGSDQLDEGIFALDQSGFQARLPSLGISELLRLHEKPNWPLSEREVQYRIKAVRGEFYRRRRIWEISKRRVILTADLDAAFQREVSKAGPGARVIVIPEGRTTLAKARLYRA